MKRLGMKGGWFVPFVTEKGTKKFTLLCTEICILINYTETLVNLNSKPLHGFGSMMRRIEFHLKGF